MRYIGSKQALLDTLSQEITTRSPKTGVFCDLFSGTASVARHFKRENYAIISNDILHFSHYLQTATIELNAKPSFAGLDFEPIEHLNNIDTAKFEYSNGKFVTENYSPSNQKETGYFTTDNAKKIDAIRQQIESWLEMNRIDEQEHAYLVAALIEAVPFVSNTTGTYGAYLKTWDKRAFKELTLYDHEIYDNGLSNVSYCADASVLINEIEGDILYIDPPYNERQYGSNYHVLETIARYDYPQVRGITAMRNNSDNQSKFCVKSQAETVLDELICKANFKHIFFSYSTDGILSEEQIKRVFAKNCSEDSVELIRIPYRRYKRVKTSHNEQVFELLFIGAKR